jgi:outer membrane protein insertion porin family
MGTGNRVAIDLSRSETQDYYNLSVTDPYFTIDGVVVVITCTIVKPS